MSVPGSCNLSSDFSGGSCEKRTAGIGKRRQFDSGFNFGTPYATPAYRVGGNGLRALAFDLATKL